MRAPALGLALGLALLAAASRPDPAGAQRPLPPGAVRIPARYDEGRWFLRPVTAQGDTLELYTDSGGGIVYVSREALERAGVPLTFDGQMQGDSVFRAPLPAFRPGAGIPAPLGDGTGQVTSVTSAVARRMSGGLPPARDGFFGNGWFADRIWIFDYPAHTLTLLPPDTPPASLGGHTVPLGFKADSAGQRAPRFPRVQAVIDGDTLDLLFDTGATTTLTDSALAAIGDGRPASRAASFITRTTADRWRARHPDWRYVPRAEARTNADMIEVPAVTVAGLAAGPVWFTIRADPNFHQFMSQWMDRRIEGALGGSALRYYRVTVDYPHKRATFETP